MRFHLASFRIPALGLCIAGVVFGLFVQQPALVAQLDLKVYDTFLHLRDKGVPSPDVAIIDIDEKSLAEVGQWPWPRYLIARLIEQLTESGAAAVGLDILFFEPDRTSPVHMRENLRRDLGVDVAFQNLPEGLEDNDLLLAEVIRQTPAVLGAKLLYDTNSTIPDVLPAQPSVIEVTPAGAMPPKSTLRKATGIALPLPELAAAAPVGTIDIAPDADGLIRHVPLITQMRDKVYPNLALRTLMMALGAKSLVLNGGVDGLESVRVKQLTIPVTPGGRFYIPFRGPAKTHKYYSAVDVLQGRVPQEDIAGRIFFVGTSATALMDIRATPFDSHYPGVEVHAATVDAILSGEAITIPSSWIAVQAFGIFIVGLVCSLLFGFARPAVYLPIGVALVAGSIYSTRTMALAGEYITPLYIIMVIAAEALAMVCMRFWQEEKQKHFLQTAFGRYVAPEVVKRIAARKEDFFAGDKREVTIIFTDIRGFTTLSEGLEPEQVVALLNRYFTPMTARIRASGGTLDKFIGDALMGFWNAPLDVPEHPVRALETALAMQDELETLNDELHALFGVRLQMGVGLHTGPVFVGNMGSEELLDYTIIGDSVNLASRLEGLTGQFGVKIVVSDAVRERCGDMVFFQPLDTVTVKGKTRPVTVFAPLRHAEAEARKDELAAFSFAQNAYRAGDFSAAIAAFAALMRDFPDVKLYTLYHARCTELAAAPPLHWDGVWASVRK